MVAAFVDPITFPGTWPEGTFHSGSRARPTSGCESQGSSSSTSSLKVDCPGCTSRIKSPSISRTALR